MKRLTTFVALGLVLVGGPMPLLSQAPLPITVILVRHAEKAGVPSDRDPELSYAGRVRALTLAHVLGEMSIDVIYSTPFKRTSNTARPIAEALGLEVTVTPIGGDFAAGMAATLREHRPGEVVLVVSHSNTVPAIINALGAGPLEQLGEDEYDDLFVVTLNGNGTAHAVRLRYGVPTP